ncbi:unnamed protein product [Phytophthora fragariaefolia]|uniref:Unnamed protein product n=1 Tax=Phytophthora fragariaefolia TaxID=1490495 RepID=A0A9W6Y622_9STRA|nr:unnamed protein product [Phytophthora fragariaefolia]
MIPAVHRVVSWETDLSPIVPPPGVPTHDTRLIYISTLSLPHASNASTCVGGQLPVSAARKEWLAGFCIAASFKRETGICRYHCTRSLVHPFPLAGTLPALKPSAKPPTAAHSSAAMTDAAAPAGVKLNASTIAEPFSLAVREYIEQEMGGAGPKLVGLLAHGDPAAKKYAEWTGKACARDGIRYELREVPKDELLEALEQANHDPEVHGILVYYPCFGPFPSFFGGTMDDFLRDSISIKKDVEGLCQFYRGNLYRNIRYVDDEHTQKCVLPCTPLAIVKILEHIGVYDKTKPDGDHLAGVNITVINRSDIVGRPLAAMLANDGADVYSADIDSLYLFRRGKLIPSEETQETACKKSRVIITGVPVKSYKLPLEWVSENTVVINVASFKNVDEAELLKIKGVQYVPLVGKVTVAMLERNLLRLYENFHWKPKKVWQ